MNPRIRLTIPSSGKVSDVVRVVASKWKLINHDEPASNVLKLYCQSLMPAPHIHVDGTILGSTANSSTGALQADCPTCGGDNIPAAKQEGPACCDGPDCSSRIMKPGVDSTIPSDLTFNALSAAAPDGLQPLQLSAMTVGELYEKTNKDKTSLKLKLLYEIKQNQDYSKEENRLRLLLQLAEFIVKDDVKLSTTTAFGTSSPSTPVVPTTPTTCHSSPVMLSSPAVTEYMRTLPKKSPLKSPLSKYRRMKRLRQSPLKTPSPLARTKPVRLQFDSQPSVVHHSFVQDVGMSDALPPSMSTTSSPLTSCASVPLHVDTLASVPFVKVLPPLLNVAQQSEVFSIAKHNAENKKSKPKKQKVHLVTVSTKALKNSGSFSRLRLNDLFRTVNENLKDVATSEDGGRLAGEVLPEDPLTPSVSTATGNSPNIPPQDVSSPLLMLQKQQREARAPRIVTHVGRPGSPQVSSTTMAQNTPSSSTVHRPSTVTITVLPSVSAIGRSPVAISTSAQVIHSPLEKLASTVAASSSLTQWAPPVSSALGSSHVAVRPLTIGSPLTNIASGSQQSAAPSLAAIKALTKPSRRQTKLRAAKNMPPPSQRPVVPKPLLYLPQMTQMKSSLGQQSDNSALGISQHSVTGSSTEFGSIASPSVLKKTEVGRSRVALPENINHQTVQSQLINLLQSMLQQQLSRQQHQQQVQSQPIPLAPEVQPVPAQSATQPLLRGVLPEGTCDTAFNLPLPVSASSPTELATSSATALSSTASYHPPSSSVPCLSEGEHTIVQSSSDTVNELLRGLATSSSNQDLALKKLSEETSDVLPTFAKAMMQLEAIGSSSAQHSIQGGSAIEDDGPQNLEDLSEIGDPVGTTSGCQRDSSGSSDSLLAFLQGEGCEIGGINDSNLRQLVEQVDFSDAFSQLKDILKTPERPKESVNIRSTSRDVSVSENVNHGPSLLDHDNSICSLLDLLSSPLKSKNSVEIQHPPPRDISVAGLPDAAGITAIHEGTDTAGIRHMIEENSVDYIRNFRELASAMNRSSS